MKDNISFDDVKKVHGDKAGEVFAEIVKIHGGGNPGDAHDGGLDLTGLSDAKRERIGKLLESAAEEKPAEPETHGKKGK